MDRFWWRPLIVCTYCVAPLLVVEHLAAFPQAISSQSGLQSQTTGKDGVQQEAATESREPVRELVAQATLGYSDRMQMHSGKLELPSLEAGKQYRITAMLSNPSEHEISFYGVELQCSCLKIEAKSNSIPAEGIGEIVFLIDVPKRSNKANVSYQARFMERGKPRPTMNLTLGFEVNNLFSVSGDQVSLELSPGQNDVQAIVPILLVAPMTFEQLELVASQNLRDLDIRLVDHPDGAHVFVVVNRRNISNGAISGEIAIRRKGTNDTVGFLLTARLRNSLELSPNSLRFVRGAGPTSSRYVAKAVLRVRSNDVSDSPEGQPVAPDVRLEIAGKPALIEMKRMGDSSVFRLNVVSDFVDGIDGDGTVEIKWSLSYGKEVHEIYSEAYFPNKPNREK